MKILSIGNFGYGWDGSICDEEHIAQALEKLGYNVVRAQRELLSEFLDLDEKFNFILISQWEGYNELVPNVLREKYNCPVVYWAFDYQADGQEWHERLVSGSDLYLSKRIADNKYSNWQWLSQDFAPEFLKPYEEPISVEKYELPPLERDIDVLFTGSYLEWATERNETLSQVNKHFNLVIHSVNPWPEEFEVRAPIMDDGLPELYSRAKVILSIDHTIEAGYWSDRNAQIIVCGQRPLFRYVPLSEARFGTDVDYFYSVDDCLEQIQTLLHSQYLLSAPSIHKYTVRARVQELLTIVRGIL